MDIKQKKITAVVGALQLCTISFITITALLGAPPALAQLQNLGSNIIIHGPDAQHKQILIDAGPMIGNQMIHVYANFVAFLIAMYLFIMLKRGRIRYPILILGFTFLITGLIPVLFGHHLMWVTHVIETSGALLTLLAFLGIFGLLNIKKRKPPSEETDKSVDT